MSADSSDKVEREIRLALVMNGGISLAVWMGGVTSEIDALRRASFGLKQESDKTLDLWQLLLRGLRARLIVDIIAGASAGGINGAILATAIARGRPLPSLRTTWIETADFGKKLIDKDPDSERGSILDGDFFLRQLRETFKAAVGTSRPSTHAEGEVPDLRLPSVDEDLKKRRKGLGMALAREHAVPRAVSLVMTGTALRGDQAGYTDATGQTFEYADNRLRFEFKRNVRGTKDDFADEPADRDDEDPAPIASDRLARAARATASFPAAFEPVFLNIGSTASAVDEALEDVPEGPDMSAVVKLATSRWVIDGGVLDNQPFGPVLDELVHQPLDTEVRRVVAYVVPALGGQGDPPRRDAVLRAPGIVESVLAATNLPRDVGILEDLGKMRELQYRAEANRAVRARLLTALLSDSEGAICETAYSVYDLYRRRRLDGAIWETRVMAATKTGRGATDLRPIPTPIDLSDRFEEISRRPWMPPSAADGAGFDKVINADPADWLWGTSVAIRFVRAMISRVRDELERRPSTGAERTALSAAALTLSTCLERVTDLGDRFINEVANAIGSDGAFNRTDEDVLARIDVAFAAAGGDQLTKRVLGGAVRTAAAAIVEAPIVFADEPGDLNAETKQRRLIRAFLLLEILEGLTRNASAPPDAPRFTFHRFGLNPHTWYFDHGETMPQTKLAGTRFGHFGAFFKQAWRWHDWIWGRLDGASQLVDVLFEKELLPLQEGMDSAFAELREAVVAVAGEGAGRALDDAREASNDPDQLGLALKRVRDVVTRKFHRTILLEELPGLVADYPKDVPPEIQTLGQDSDDEHLRVALEHIHGRFTTTPLGELTGGETGNEGKWLTVASALRALTLDERVPDVLHRPLCWAASWARRQGDTSFKGHALRGAEKVTGGAAKALGSLWRGGTGAVRAVTGRS